MTTPKLTIAALLLLTLTGCAQLKDVKPGTPITQVLSEYGKPTYECTLPSGDARMIWSQQPFGQYAWATDIKPDGVTTGMTQVLDEESFNRLARGIWTPDDVLCAFGPPAEQTQMGLPSVRKEVWSYRFRQHNVWYSLMYVTFSQDGTRVIDYGPGPDPMYMDDWGFPRRL